jgi:hypothetical protein
VCAGRAGLELSGNPGRVLDKELLELSGRFVVQIEPVSQGGKVVFSANKSSIEIVMAGEQPPDVFGNVAFYGV